VLDGIIMSESKAFRADLARSARLFRAFRTEQSAPEAYYTALARDTIHQLSQYADLDGRIVIDVGGGPGFFVRELNRMGARSFCIDADSGEMAMLGPPEHGSIVASATSMPLASGSVDVCFSSNVLEHVKDPAGFIDEMIRITRPGGLVYLSYTVWLSPWGGHETAPFHYLGGHYAARRYARRHGKEPKNLYGQSMFPTGVGPILSLVRRRSDVAVVEARPRYYPRWCKFLVLIPGLRELLTWNLLVILRRQA